MSGFEDDAWIEEDNAALEAALRQVLGTRPPTGQEPVEGWVMLVGEPNRVMFGSETPARDDWEVLEFRRTTGVWRHVGTDRVRVDGTASERAMGIRLRWSRPSFVADRGVEPDVYLRLHNDRGKVWINTLTAGALVDLVDDQTGTPVDGGAELWDAPSSDVLALPPGGAITVRKVWPSALLDGRVPPGRYRVNATLHEHGLRSDPAVLEVVDPVVSFRSSVWERYANAVTAGPQVDYGPEEWARRCITRALGQEVDTHNDGTQVNPCALRLGPDDAPERMIDVVGAFDPAWAHSPHRGTLERGLLPHRPR